MKKKKRIISIKVLPGEPLDGTGQVCIHLWVTDPKGRFEQPHVMQVDKDGRRFVGPAKGYIACNPNLNPSPKIIKGVHCVTTRTDDARAVTCPKCLACEICKKLLAVIENPEPITQSDIV